MRQFSYFLYIRGEILIDNIPRLQISLGIFAPSSNLNNRFISTQLFSKQFINIYNQLFTKIGNLTLPIFNYSLKKRKRNNVKIQLFIEIENTTHPKLNYL